MTKENIEKWIVILSSYQDLIKRRRVNEETMKRYELLKSIRAAGLPPESIKWFKL
jgi:hypothetical protein